MPWNVIILPLLGGFVFLDWCYYSRLRHQRIEGNRLLLESAFFGVFLLGFASMIVAVLRSSSIGQIIARGWFAVVPQYDPGSSYAGTAFVALLLGLVFAFSINLVVDRRKKLFDVVAFAADQAGDYALRIIFESLRERRFLTILTSNGMAYIGYVSVSPNLKRESQLVLTVFAQGSVQKDTNQVEWHGFYPEWLRDHKKAKNYMVAIPTRGLESIRFFNIDLDMPTAR